jgi:hypothetical protein
MDSSKEALPEASASELFALFDSVLCELRQRGLVRSSNNPAADYAEWLACKALGLSLQPKSTRGFDATCPNGVRYEVKSRRRTPQNQSVQLGHIRGLTERQFDFLIGVIFKPDFSVDYAAKIPYDIVQAKATFSEHANASILQFKQELLTLRGVVDLTKEFVAASRA